MMFKMLYAKLHRATVTHVERDYEGSLGLDRALIEKTGMLPGQQIDVLNINNGARFTTYVIQEEHGSGTIGVYGAAAHLCKPGDLIIVIAYALMDETEAKRHKPTVLVLGKDNEIVSNV